MTSIVTAEEKIKIALDWVAKQEPFVIPVVLSRWAVKAVANPSTCPTMQTDGRSMSYNPAFVDALSICAVKAIVLHETGHCISHHHHRRGNKNPKGWNIACDLALNCLLFKGYLAAFDHDTNRLYAELIHSKEHGGCFVGFGSFDKLPHNKSAEEYYELLKAQNPPPPPQPPTPQPPTRTDGEPCNPQDGGDDDYEDGEDDAEDKPKGKGKGKGKPDDEAQDGDDQDGKGQDGDEGQDGESGDGLDIDPSDFEDGEETGDNGDASSLGNGKSEHDPFANLPDPTQTFGGGVEDAPEDATLREDEAKLILEVLLGGDGYGRTGLGNIVSQYKQQVEGDPEAAAQVNWRKELEKFLRTQHAAGFKYDRPSRRHGHRSDVVLPARRARSKTKGLCIIDTSGSMGDGECNQALTHLGKILSLFPQSSVTAIQCDTGVQASKEYRASDFPIREFEGWKGRGGTDMAPAFRWAKERRSQYDWIIIVSDMEWCWWQAPDPGIPTLWINTRVRLFGGSDIYGAGHQLPFGKLVNFHAPKAA
jgi:predicted metal-dependent peptidase